MIYIIKESWFRKLLQQDYIVSYDEELWTSGPALSTVQNFGPTLEWIVQAHFQQRYQALTRRCVHFTEWETSRLNDLDLLAFTNELVLIAEVKSSIHIKPDKVVRFVQRAQRFPADVALFLIDTMNSAHVRKHAASMMDMLGNSHISAEEYDWQDDGLILFLPPTIYVANTARSITHVLDHILDPGLQRKRTGLEYRDS